MTLDLEPELAYHGTPRYFVWGNKGAIHTVSEYLAVLKQAEALHKGSVEQARRLTKEAGGLDVVHTPFLDMPRLIEASHKKGAAKKA